MTIIPTVYDVLCGKDRACLQAEGSRRFRDIIDSHVSEYTQATSKFEKMGYTKKIYEQVSQTARFLKFNESNNSWEEISSMAARDKVGHALRFASSAKRRSNKIKKTHKRTGSSSSSSSEESNNGVSPFGWDSLMGHLQNGMLYSAATVVTQESQPQEPAPAPVQPVVVETTSSLPVNHHQTSPSLDQFLDLELQFDIPNISSSDDLDPLLLQAAKKPESDPLDNFMEDILSVVNTIETEQQQTEDVSILSLLSEPVGEWDEDPSLVLA